MINGNKKAEKVDYDRIANGTVKEKLKVAKLFQENFKILENIKKSMWRTFAQTHMGPSDQLLVMSAVFST